MTKCWAGFTTGSTYRCMYLPIEIFHCMHIGTVIDVIINRKGYINDGTRIWACMRNKLRINYVCAFFNFMGRVMYNCAIVKVGQQNFNI